MLFPTDWFIYSLIAQMIVQHVDLWLIKQATKHNMVGILIPLEAGHPVPGWRVRILGEKLKPVSHLRIKSRIKRVARKVKCVAGISDTLYTLHSFGEDTVSVMCELNEYVDDDSKHIRVAYIEFEVNDAHDAEMASAKNSKAITRWLYSQWPEFLAWAYARKCHFVEVVPYNRDSVDRFTIYRKLGFQKQGTKVMIYWL